MEALAALHQQLQLSTSDLDDLLSKVEDKEKQLKTLRDSHDQTVEEMTLLAQQKTELRGEIQRKSLALSAIEEECHELEQRRSKYLNELLATMQVSLDTSKQLVATTEKTAGRIKSLLSEHGSQDCDAKLAMLSTTICEYKEKYQNAKNYKENQKSVEETQLLLELKDIEGQNKFVNDCLAALQRKNHELAEKYWDESNGIVPYSKHNQQQQQQQQLHQKQSQQQQSMDQEKSKVYQTEIRRVVTEEIHEADIPVNENEPGNRRKVPWYRVLMSKSDTLKRQKREFKTGLELLGEEWVDL